MTRCPICDRPGVERITYGPSGERVLRGDGFAEWRAFQRRTVEVEHRDGTRCLGTVAPS